MIKTYNELLKDPSFMEMIFTEISKLDTLVDKIARFDCPVSQIPLSVEEKEKLNGVDITIRNMFKLGGCDVNLPVSAINDLVDMYGDVYGSVKGLSDQELDAAAAGAAEIKNLLSSPRRLRAFEDLQRNLKTLAE